MARPGRELPKEPLSRAGEKGLGEKLPVGDAAWTWVNFWAAWCVPCKEEMPRLKAWEKQLQGEPHRMRVVFVSLDDDERQLEAFLAAQPPDGVRSTYWLKDGRERDTWLKGIDLQGEPQLPAHLLIDPKGKLRCVIEGAVEDADFARVRHLLTRRI